MAQILQGKAVVEALNERLKAETLALNEQGIFPTLGIVRVGEREDDIAYEKGATKRAETIGVQVRHFRFPQEISQEELLKEMEKINGDDSIHGVLLFRPLPRQLDDRVICGALLPAKDIDGITDQSMAGVYAGKDLGFPPCTPKACLEILDHYGIDATGKSAVVIGRSLVVGKPAAMMLIQKNATVTVCHTKTEDMPAVCREADILIAAAGKAKSIGKEYFHADQIIIDVGINMDEAGNLCGDVDFQEAEPIVKAITPVPGGVGTVTTSTLVKHVIEAAKRQKGK